MNPRVAPTRTQSTPVSSACAVLAALATLATLSLFPRNAVLLLPAFLLVYSAHRRREPTVAQYFARGLSGIAGGIVLALLITTGLQTHSCTSGSNIACVHTTITRDEAHNELHVELTLRNDRNTVTTLRLLPPDVGVFCVVHSLGATASSTPDRTGFGTPPNYANPSVAMTMQPGEDTQLRCVLSNPRALPRVGARVQGTLTIVYHDQDAPYAQTQAIRVTDTVS